MSKPIVLTEEIKRQIRDEFLDSLDKAKMADGKVSYSKCFKYDDKGAALWLKPEAYKKMLALVTEFSDEVGWHGTVSRTGDNEFVIEDIFVYPQEVTGSTVNTDQKEYSMWLLGLDDEVFPKLRMQGHSHVNMVTSPSTVDDRHRQQILDQLEPDMFYVFMVWNKRLDVHTLIYDMERNILYEDKDIDVKLLGSEGMDGFLSEAKENVQKKTFPNKKNKGKEKVEIDTDLAEFGYYPYNRHDPYDLGGEAWTR